MTDPKKIKAEAFRSAYLAAHYQVGDLRFKLSDEATNTKLFDGHPFALITAHNPRSEPLSEAENDERHVRLVEVVERLGLEYKVAAGQSPDSSWQEKSLAIFNVDLEQAVKLGRQFSQNAILFGEADKVALVWSKSGEADWCYPQILPNREAVSD